MLADLDPVNNPSLTHLLVANNTITTLKNLRQLPMLRVLDLSGNQLTSIEGIEQLALLNCLRLPNNKIQDINEARRLAHLEQFRELDLSGMITTHFGDDKTNGFI